VLVFLQIEIKKTGPQRAGLSILIPELISAAMPMAMPMAVTMPTYLGDSRVRAILDRCGCAGIAERQCLGALARSGQNEQCANGCKPQNFHHLHIFYSPWIQGEVTSTPGRIELAASPPRGL
jgi:hypothetical protein